MLMCTVICKVSFPTGKGVPEARGRAGCQLPATDTQGSTHEPKWCWICYRSSLHGWKLLQSGSKRKPLSLLWLSWGWSWQICHLAPSGAESPVNTPWSRFRQTFKCMLAVWEDELCEHVFQGGKSTLPFLCSSAPLWLKPGCCRSWAALRCAFCFLQNRGNTGRGGRTRYSPFWVSSSSILWNHIHRLEEKMPVCERACHQN